MIDFHPGYLLNAVLYAFAGIVAFLAAFYAIARMGPYDLWKEVVENRNTAVAILVGAMSLAVGIIIASAVH